MCPLSSESLEILYWNDELFGESVHLTEQHLWQGEETEGRVCYIFVILTRSGNSKLRKGYKKIFTTSTKEPLGFYT